MYVIIISYSVLMFYHVKYFQFMSFYSIPILIIPNHGVLLEINQFKSIQSKSFSRHNLLIMIMVIKKLISHQINHHINYHVTNNITDHKTDLDLIIQLT
jgi:hypothetical protein